MIRAEPAIELVLGDIAKQGTDAIVNAANSSLLGGSGVDGAIHAAAGPRLLAACRELRRDRLPDGLPVGEAVATPGFDLPAKWVIHTVGPNRRVGQTDPALLARAHTSSLEVARRLGAASISFPAISAGAYGWAPDQVAEVALAAIGEAGPGSGVGLIRFVLFSDRLLEAFRAAHAR